MTVSSGAVRTTEVGFDRLAGWLERYQAAHPATSWQLTADRVVGTDSGGGGAEFEVPFPPLRDSGAGLESVLSHVARPWQVGILLVRRGGFVVAHVLGPDVVQVKVGRRHVQGRTKAGGWSQHRFSRRRDNQARVAFDAAADHAAQILLPVAADLHLLGAGGDRAAVRVVLDRPDLRPLSAVPRRWCPVSGDPRREALDRVVASVRSVAINLYDATGRDC